jgi:hypothetical protein
MRTLGFFRTTLVALPLVAAIACSDGGTTTSSGGPIVASSSGGSSSSSGGSSSSSGGSSSSSSSSGGSSSGTVKETFPCGPTKKCEVGREVCQYIDGSPFSCAVITVGNQCNAQRCAAPQASFGYLCERTNFPRTSCTALGGDPCKMTIACD